MLLFVVLLVSAFGSLNSCRMFVASSACVCCTMPTHVFRSRPVLPSTSSLIEPDKCSANFDTNRPLRALSVDKPIRVHRRNDAIIVRGTRSIDLMIIL